MFERTDNGLVDTMPPGPLCSSTLQASMPQRSRLPLDALGANAAIRSCPSIAQIDTVRSASTLSIYTTEHLRESVKSEAKRRGCSEAQVIRDAISNAVVRPRPRAGLIDAEPFAARVDEFLVGFGER